MLIGSHETHPAADVFPMLEGDELVDLSNDIALHGLRLPIVLCEGRVLDGRNRLRACIGAAVEPAFEEFDGDDPVAFVISTNIKRRHLTESQRAMVAARLAKLRRGRPKKSPIGEIDRDRAAELLNVSPRNVDRAKAVLRDGHPDLVAAVDAGDVAVSAAAELARTEPQEQQVSRLAAMLGPGERDDWCTPESILDAVRGVFGGVIELDPCSNANSDVGARTAWTVEDDGLARDWTEHGTIFVNPPYGPAIGPWVEKCIAAGRETDVIALLPARTDTKWFHQILEQPFGAIAFLKGRLTFKGAPASATFPSAVVHWGGRAEFVDVFRPLCTRVWEAWG